MQEQGKAGKIIKNVLKAHAGRKHRDGLNLDTIKDGTGLTHVTPQAVHQASNNHFQDWYSMPYHYLYTLHSVPDWRPYLSDFSTFQSHFAGAHVPLHLIERIFNALQDVPQADSVRLQLSDELSEAPTLEELQIKIGKLKHYSSPGMSGLSYNMLHKAPKIVIQEIHKCLVQFWTDKHIPTSWKWRWLVPIPKKPTDSPTLEELRPLMLCEALRKV